MTVDRSPRSLVGTRPFVVPDRTGVGRSRPYRPDARRRRGNAGAGPATWLTAAAEAATERVAIRYAGRELSYRDLDELSSRWARLLIEHGISPGDRVAVAIPGSVESVLAVWAVAKSGAAFVPVDPAVPAERARRLLTEAEASMGLTVRACGPDLPGMLPWLVLDDPGTSAEARRQPAHPVSYVDRVRPLMPQDPAWVRHVSGAAGCCEMVVVTRAALAGWGEAVRTRYRLDADARVLHPGAVSLPELLLAGAVGATSVLAPTAHDAAGWTRLLAAERISHVCLSPTMPGSVEPADLRELRSLAVAADTNSPTETVRWAQNPTPGAPGRTLHDASDRTEAAFLSVAGTPRRPRTPVALDSARPGEYAAVLGDRLHPVPDHRPPGSTAHRFIAEPPSRSAGGTGPSMYRTAAGRFGPLGRAQDGLARGRLRLAVEEIDTARRRAAQAGRLPAHMVPTLGPASAALPGTSPTPGAPEHLADAFAVVLPLRATGTGAPLFCIHPLLGLAWSFAGLARYLGDRPLYGLQSPAVGGARTLPATMSAWARRYVAEIRRIQPTGPYHLLGWSLGGMLAHTVAVQLRAAGDRVETLALLDAPLPGRGAPADRTVTVADLLGAAGPAATPGLVPTGVPAARAPELIAGLAATLPPPFDQLPAERIDSLVAGVAHAHTVMATFEPGLFDGDLVYFAACADRRDAPDDAAGWRTRVSGAVHVEPVPATHWQMTSPDALAHLGPVLGRWITTGAAACRSRR